MLLQGVLVRTVNGLITLSVVLFVASRVMLMYNTYHEQDATYREDVAYCAHVCTNVTVIKEIGHQNSATCPKKCNTKPASWSAAFDVMLNKTHACGDQPCGTLARNALTDWRLMVGSIAFLFTMPYVMWTWLQVLGGKMASMWRRRRRNKKLNRAQSASFSSAAVFQQQQQLQADSVPLKPTEEPLLRRRPSCSHLPDEYDEEDDDNYGNYGNYIDLFGGSKRLTVTSSTF